MTEAALLAAVLDDYDDDLPRLALADWWEGNGRDDRAEFVRVQCQLDRKPPDGERGNCHCFAHGILLGDEHAEWGPLCRHCALRRRERELLDSLNCTYPIATNGYVWSLPCSHRRPEFRRGFVRALTCTAADWLGHGDAITAAQPIEEVTLTTWPDVVFGPTGETVREWRADESQMRQAIVERDLRHRWGKVRHWHLPPPDIRRMFQEAADRIRRDTGGIVAPHVPFVP